MGMVDFKKKFKFRPANKLYIFIVWVYKTIRPLKNEKGRRMVLISAERNIKNGNFH